MSFLFYRPSKSWEDEKEIEKAEKKTSENNPRAR
jgi:hypothetical protein